MIVVADLVAETVGGTGSGVAVGALGGLGTVAVLVAWMWRMTSWSNTRVDTITAAQIKQLADERDRFRLEREAAEERAHQRAEDADIWAKEVQRLAIELAKAQMEVEDLRRGGTG